MTSGSDGPLKVTGQENTGRTKLPAWRRLRRSQHDRNGEIQPGRAADKSSPGGSVCIRRSTARNCARAHLGAGVRYSVRRGFPCGQGSRVIRPADRGSWWRRTSSRRGEAAMLVEVAYQRRPAQPRCRTGIASPKTSAGRDGTPSNLTVLAPGVESIEGPSWPRAHGGRGNLFTRRETCPDGAASASPCGTPTA